MPNEDRMFSRRLIVVIVTVAVVLLFTGLSKFTKTSLTSAQSNRQVTTLTVGNEWVRQPLPAYPLNFWISTDQEVEIRDLGQGGSIFTLRPDKTLLRDGVKVDPPNFGRVKGLALEFRTTEPGRIANVTLAFRPK